MSVADHPDVGAAHDLTDYLTVEMAASQLDRADLSGAEALARWAKEWGRPAIISLRHLCDMDD